MSVKYLHWLGKFCPTQSPLPFYHCSCICKEGTQQKDYKGWVSLFCLFHLPFCFKLYNPPRYMNPSVSTGCYAQSSSFKLCTGTADGSRIKCISWASTGGFLAKKISLVQWYRTSEGTQLRAGMKRYTSRWHNTPQFSICALEDAIKASPVVSTSISNIYQGRADIILPVIHPLLKYGLRNQLTP